MCLTPGTMKNWIHIYDFSINDQLFIIEAYDKMWKNLDHSRNYCLNPEAVAFEILKHYGKVTENRWMAKKLSSAQRDKYEKTFIILMNALDKR